LYQVTCRLRCIVGRVLTHNHDGNHRYVTTMVAVTTGRQVGVQGSKTRAIGISCQFKNRFHKMSATGKMKGRFLYCAPSRHQSSLYSFVSGIH